MLHIQNPIWLQLYGEVRGLLLEHQDTQIREAIRSVGVTARAATAWILGFVQFNLPRCLGPEWVGICCQLTCLWFLNQSAVFLPPSKNRGNLGAIGHTLALAFPEGGRTKGAAVCEELCPGYFGRPTPFCSVRVN